MFRRAGAPNFSPQIFSPPIFFATKFSAGPVCVLAADQDAGDARRPGCAPAARGATVEAHAALAQARDRRASAGRRGAVTTRACTWCGDPYTPRKTGGRPQRFCSEGCRRAFGSGCRAWAGALLASGLLPVSALKRTLRQRARSSQRNSAPLCGPDAEEGKSASYAPPAGRSQIRGARLFRSAAL